MSAGNKASSKARIDQINTKVNFLMRLNHSLTS